MLSAIKSHLIYGNHNKELSRLERCRGGLPLPSIQVPALLSLQNVMRSGYIMSHYPIVLLIKGAELPFYVVQYRIQKASSKKLQCEDILGH